MFRSRERKPPVITRPIEDRPRGGEPFSSGERDFSVDRDAPKSCSKGWLGKLMILGAAAAGFGVSANNDLLLGQIASVVMGLSALHGHARGGLRKTIMLPATILTFWYLYSNPDVVAPLVNMVGASGPFANMVGSIVVAAVVLMLIGMPVKAIRNKIMNKRPTMAAFDRFFGSSIGLAEGGVTMLLMMWMSVLLQPTAENAANHPNSQAFQKKIAGTILEITDEIDNSPLKEIARDHNLLAEIPSVKKQLAAINEDGSIDASQLDPQTQNMINELIQGMDPELMRAAAEKLGLPAPNGSK